MPKSKYIGVPVIPEIDNLHPKRDDEHARPFNIEKSGTLLKKHIKNIDLFLYHSLVRQIVPLVVCFESE